MVKLIAAGVATVAAVYALLRWALEAEDEAALGEQTTNFVDVEEGDPLE